MDSNKRGNLVRLIAVEVESTRSRKPREKPLMVERWGGNAVGIEKRF